MGVSGSYRELMGVNGRYLRLEGFCSSRQPLIVNY